MSHVKRHKLQASCHKSQVKSSELFVDLGRLDPQPLRRQQPEPVNWGEKGRREEGGGWGGETSAATTSQSSSLFEGGGGTLLGRGCAERFTRAMLLLLPTLPMMTSFTMKSANQSKTKLNSIDVLFEGGLPVYRRLSSASNPDESAMSHV